MCVINGPVDHVANTRLLVLPSQDGQRQLTVYANSVTSPADNAMILPVPHPESVSFHDLSQYPDLFRDVESCWQYQQRTFGSQGARSMSLTADGRTILPVFNVGSYRASIVPGLGDFDRLDKSDFQINPQVYRLFENKYRAIDDAPVGFIVCRLRSGNNNYHPFAYSHRRTPSGRFFIPTMHFHPSMPATSGGVRGLGAFINESGWQSEAHDWDHTVYTAATGFEAQHVNNDHFGRNGEMVYIGTSPVKWDKLPAEYQHCSAQRLSRWRFEGARTNEDLVPVCTFVPAASVVGPAPAPVPVAPNKNGDGGHTTLWNYLFNW